jgi:hypothetical protein
MHPVRGTVTASGHFCLRNRSKVHAISESEFRLEPATELLSAWSHLVLRSWLLSVMRILPPEANKKLSDSMNRIAPQFLQPDGEAAPLVEFSDEMGQTYAMAGLKPDQLLALHRNAEAS